MTDAPSSAPPTLAAAIPAPAPLQPAPLQPAPMQPKANGKPKRRLLLGLISAACLIGIAIFAYQYWTVGRFLISTDDAYVKADLSIISAKIAGYVTRVVVKDNTYVHQGDLLATIDEKDYQLAVEAAQDKIATQEATVTRIEAQIKAQGALIAQAQAQLQAAQSNVTAAAADLQRASAEYERTTKLVANAFATQQRAEQSLADRDRAQASVASGNANVEGARAAVASAQAAQTVLKAQAHEAEQVHGELKTALDKARLDLSYTHILAPFDGIVGNRAVQTGQYLQPGTRLLALLPPDSLYVEANFKETQIAKLKIGQTAHLMFDAANAREITGTIESLAPASGSQYSLLPPENATGNFTKIVQRVPVRIALPASALAEDLRLGTSVEVSVDTRTSGSDSPRNP